MNTKRPPWRPPSVYTPFFRRFADERSRDLSETIALYERVRGEFKHSRWNDDEALSDTAAAILAEIFALVPHPIGETLLSHTSEGVVDFLMNTHHVFNTANIDWDTAVFSAPEMVELRQFLRRQEHFLANQDRIVALLTDTLINLFAGILQRVPDTSGSSDFNVPLFAMCKDLNDVVDRSIGTLAKQEIYDASLFEPITQRIYQNVCQVSGIVPHQDTHKPFLAADKSPLRDLELLSAYLRETPLYDFFTSPVPFAIPRSLYVEHGALFAPSGHGKTQCLQHLVYRLLQEADPPSMFIVDSQGDMLRAIERLELFNTTLKDRLVILDPEDESPPALNLFHLGTYDATIDELFQYIFTAIDSELTSKQATAVTYLLRLMAAIPDATIDTLRQVMEDHAKSLDRSPWAPYIAGLDPITRDFFANQFFHKSAMAQTREQVARRLYTLLANPVFVKIFAARENKFDALQAMQEKKIVLINTSQKTLGQGSSVLGRYLIAQALAAAYRRPEHQRHLALLIVDEASEYFDAKTERILSQARKFGLGLIFASQYLEQMSPEVKAAVNGNTAIKLAGPVAYSDAAALAREMYTDTDFLRSMAKHQSATEFAAYVRGLTPKAVRLTVPFGTLEAAPRMSAEAHRALRAANRERYGISRQTPASPVEPAARKDEPAAGQPAAFEIKPGKDW